MRRVRKRSARCGSETWYSLPCVYEFRITQEGELLLLGKA